MDTLALSGIVVVMVCLLALAAIISVRSRAASRDEGVKPKRSGNEVGIVAGSKNEPGQEHIELMVGWPPLISR